MFDSKDTLILDDFNSFLEKLALLSLGDKVKCWFNIYDELEPNVLDRIASASARKNS